MTNLFVKGVKIKTRYLLIFILLSISVNAPALTIEGIIDKYGKESVVSVLKKKLENNQNRKLTIDYYGETKQVYNPDQKFITPETIQTDLFRVSLSVNQLEKIILEKEQIKKENIENAVVKKSADALLFQKALSKLSDASSYALKCKFDMKTNKLTSVRSLGNCEKFVKHRNDALNMMTTIDDITIFLNELPKQKKDSATRNLEFIEKIGNEYYEFASDCNAIAKKFNIAGMFSYECKLDLKSYHEDKDGNCEKMMTLAREAQDITESKTILVNCFKKLNTRDRNKLSSNVEILGETVVFYKEFKKRKELN